MPTKQPDLSIVIPSYCEERRIGATLNQLADFLKHDRFFKQKDVEVLIVAADAPDRTQEIAQAKKQLFEHFVVLRPGARVGKGRDVQYGMLRARGKIVVFMDADLATPLHHLEEFYLTCERGGGDVVVGTRNLLTFRSSTQRNIFAYVGNMLYRLASGIWVEDTQCGFKMFTKQACQLCFSKLTIMGWGFDIEVLAIAKANGLSLKSIRIDDWEDKLFSSYNEGPLKITLRTIRDFCYVTYKRATKAYVRSPGRKRNEK